MSHEDKARATRPQETPAEPWDSGRYMAPDPSLPLEEQLKWYQVSHHILLLNCSELCRRKSAAAADKELERSRATQPA